MTRPLEIQQGELYPIRTVATLTGVNPITLRAWESRYGLIEPVRTDSGHRLYTQEQIDLINRVVGMLDRGVRIGQVKAALEAEGDEAPGPAGGEGLWQRQFNHMIASVIRFDEAGLERTYGEALALYPIDEVTRNLLKPVLTELGRRWAAGEGSIAEEHFFAFYLRNKLGARFHHRHRPQDGPALLMTSFPEERHEIGLLLFALAANERGFRTVLLGADLPLEELPLAAKKSAVDAVLLSGFMKPDEPVLKRGLPDLVEQAGVPVMVGGQVSVVAADAIRKAGAEPLGTDVEKALDRLRARLT